MSQEVDKQKLYEALIDAVQRSKNFASIPLPAILDNQLEQLNEKFGYNKDDIPKDAKPAFPDEKEPIKETKEEIKKKLKNKLKNLQKRRNKEQKKDKTLSL